MPQIVKDMSDSSFRSRIDLERSELQRMLKEILTPVGYSRSSFLTNRSRFGTHDPLELLRDHGSANAWSDVASLIREDKKS